MVLVARSGAGDGTLCEFHAAMRLTAKLNPLYAGLVGRSGRAAIARARFVPDARVRARMGAGERQDNGGLHRTRRWRKPDSNCWSRGRHPASMAGIASGSRRLFLVAGMRLEAT
jgi:hypothetical protein